MDRHKDQEEYVVNFDEVARSWDKEERRHMRAKAVAEIMRAGLSTAAGGRALDFGCGTGLLSFELREDFSQIVLLDASAGMIDVLRRKIERDDEARRGKGSVSGAAMLPVCGTLGDGAPLLSRFDLAYSMLVLHHLSDTAAALLGLASVLRHGGALRIVDLDKEDGSYHEDEAGFDGYDGFDREDLAALTVGAGFAKVRFETAWVERRVEGGSTREYPMFLMSAEKA
jgi:ubiquinone/menaquinone biosynthesis C-methylase UbiE